MGWIREHRGHLYPGALSEILWPLSCVQCSNFNTREEIAAFLADPARPYVFKNGRIYSEFSVAEILSGCSLGVPEVTADGADWWLTCIDRHIFGTNFGVAQGALGKVYLGNAALRDDVTVWVEQTVHWWVLDHIFIHVDLGPLAGDPEVWIYVKRDSALIKMNCQGFHRNVVVP